jgi:hypothetical protein
MAPILSYQEHPDLTFELDSLNLTDQLLTNSVAQTIRQMKGIATLNLTNTQLSDRAFALIGESAADSLRNLDVSRNPGLTTKTYTFICGSFMRLEYLNLELNHIKDEGCMALLTPQTHE